jgi:hypothetical protein
LDILGTLDRFSAVFGVEAFRENGVSLSQAKRLALWEKLRGLPQALRRRRP